jgi:hypothetical protein
MVTPETLATDPQAVIYTAHECPTGGLFTMHYVIKPKSQDGVPKHEPVARRFTIAELDRALDALDRIAIQILWFVTHVKDPNAIPHRSITACEGVGRRCPYAGLCHLHERGVPPPWQSTHHESKTK